MDNAQQLHVAARDGAHGAASASLSLPPAVEEHILSIGHRGRKGRAWMMEKYKAIYTLWQFNIAA